MSGAELASVSFTFAHRYALFLLRSTRDGVVPETATLAGALEDLVQLGLAQRHELPTFSYWTLKPLPPVTTP